MLLDTAQAAGHKGGSPPADKLKLDRKLDRDGQDKTCRRKWPRNDKDGAKIGQDSERRGQDGARMGPRWGHYGPRWSRGGPRWDQDSAKMGQDGAEMDQDGAKAGTNLVDDSTALFKLFFVFARAPEGFRSAGGGV